MGAMVFLPAGYALAGPISLLIGVRGSLVLAATWVIASTLVVMRVRSVREFTLDPAPEEVIVVAAT
jgi:hypothetical protein